MTAAPSQGPCQVAEPRARGLGAWRRAGRRQALAANGNGVPRLECPTCAAGCEESHDRHSRRSNRRCLRSVEAPGIPSAAPATGGGRGAAPARRPRRTGWPLAGLGRGPALPPASAGIRGHGASRTAAPERRLKLANLSARIAVSPGNPCHW